MYFPRILAHDKLRGHFESFAPCGAVAGMLARSDEASPMWGSAKLEEAVLRPGYRPACLVAEDRRRQLAIRGVNTLQAVRSVMRIGVKPRTLAGGTAAAAEWQSLAARRLALFILNSIEHGTRWVIGTQARAQAAETITAQVRSFFMQLYEAGAFPGRRMEEAFFVICDRRNPAPGGVATDEFRFLDRLRRRSLQGISQFSNIALGGGQQGSGREHQPPQSGRVLPGGAAVGGQARQEPV